MCLVGADILLNVSRPGPLFLLYDTLICDVMSAMLSLCDIIRVRVSMGKGSIKQLSLRD